MLYASMIDFPFIVLYDKKFQFMYAVTLDCVLRSFRVSTFHAEQITDCGFRSLSNLSFLTWAGFLT